MLKKTLRGKNSVFLRFFSKSNKKIFIATKKLICVIRRKLIDLAKRSVYNQPMNSQKYPNVSFANLTIFTLDNFKQVTKIKRERTFFKLRCTMILAAFILGGAMLINIEGCLYYGLAIAILGMTVVPLLVWLLPRNTFKKQWKQSIESNGGQPAEIDYQFGEKYVYFTTSGGKTNRYEYSEIRFADRYGDMVIIGFKMFQPLYVDMKSFTLGKESDFLPWLCSKRDPRFLNASELKFAAPQKPDDDYEIK